MPGTLSDVPCRMRRVNGNLNLSRAIGDLKYKGNDALAPDAQIITAQPDIVKAGAPLTDSPCTHPCLRLLAML